MPALELVVATQNAWGGAPGWPRRRQALARALGQARPDLIGLQEVHTRLQPGPPTQAHELAEELGGYSTAFAPAWRKPRGVEEGVALLYRAELASRAERLLEQRPGDRLDRIARRVALACTLRLGGQLLEVLVAHLSMSRAARARNLAELGALAEEVAARPGPRASLLLGDLNSPPSRAALELLGPGWLDAWALTHPHARGATWPAPLPLRRYDAILALGWEVLSCSRLPSAGSDHRGVLARLRLPG